MNSETIDNKQEQSNPAALATLDMAEVFALVRAEEARRELPRHTPDIGLPPLGSPVVSPTITRLSSPRLALDLLPLGNQPLAVSVRQLDRNSYQVLMAPPHGVAQPVTLDVPVGLQRQINVATLKAMLGASTRDIVFRKSQGDERWTACPDSYPVDLEDRTQVFKIREWAILS